MNRKEKVETAIQIVTEERTNHEDRMKDYEVELREHHLKYDSIIKQNEEYIMTHRSNLVTHIPSRPARPSKTQIKNMSIKRITYEIMVTDRLAKELFSIALYVLDKPNSKHTHT